MRRERRLALACDANRAHSSVAKMTITRIGSLRYNFRGRRLVSAGNGAAGLPATVLAAPLGLARSADCFWSRLAPCEGMALKRLALAFPRIEQHFGTGPSAAAGTSLRIAFSLHARFAAASVSASNFACTLAASLRWRSISARCAFSPCRSRATRRCLQPIEIYRGLAGVAGLEPATPGFGDRCSTN